LYFWGVHFQDISAFRTKLSDRAQEVSELQHQLQELQNTLSSAQSDRDREQRGHADMIAAMELQLSNRNQQVCFLVFVTQLLIYLIFFIKFFLFCFFQLAELRSELSSSAESLFKVQSQLRDATELSEVSQSRHTTEVCQFVYFSVQQIIF
jgi:hypothetical protein